MPATTGTPRVWCWRRMASSHRCKSDCRWRRGMDSLCRKGISECDIDRLHFPGFYLQWSCLLNNLLEEVFEIEPAVHQPGGFFFPGLPLLKKQFFSCPFTRRQWAGAPTLF